MNPRAQKRHPWSGYFSLALSIAGLWLAVSTGCSPVSSQPSQQTAPSVTEVQAAPATANPSATSEAPLPTATTEAVLPTAASEALIPAGWATHTSQQCEYAISYPVEMQVSDGGTNSQMLGANLANPDEGTINFIYVSVITPGIQKMVQDGTYNNDVYNYNPADTDILLNLQVGESKSLHEEMNLGSGFTYQRQPDAMISDYTALAFENTQPWEFPSGTKEMRYYVSTNGCTFMIGGYLDTTGSTHPGAIAEDLFHQIIATVRLTP